MKTIEITDYGVVPNSGEDAVPAIRRAIKVAADFGEDTVIRFPHGRYDLYPDGAMRRKYYVSNTASEIEVSNPVKTIGIYIEKAKGLTLEGNGSLIVYHGVMTLMVLDCCDNIEVCNFIFDYDRPTISEMRIEAVCQHYWDVQVSAPSRYVLENGKLIWEGKGWRHRGGPAQQFDPVNNRTWRVPDPTIDASLVEEIEPGMLRLWFGNVPSANIGDIIQMRDSIRDQVGILIISSRVVVLRNVDIRYMHGLGIVGQYSENLEFYGMNLRPDPLSGRTAAAFADFLHLSGIRGKVIVRDCVFEGAHDDAINIHGTHLRVVEQFDTQTVLLRFMHHQSYGFEAFAPGDAIDFVRAHSLIAYSSHTVRMAKLVNDRDILLTLEDDVPLGLEEGDVIENVTWTPEVTICGNRFSRIPTRGVLITTRRKVTIENNLFVRMGMSAILIANDARSWYESGKVQDVTMRGNTFMECGGVGNPVIMIEPENSEVSYLHPVHRNIIVENNRFLLSNSMALSAKSTANIVINGNHFLVSGNESNEEDRSIRLSFTACSQVVVSDNIIENVGFTPTILLNLMPEGELTVNQEATWKKTIC